MNRESIIQLVRKIQTLSSIIIFISIFILCWVVTGFKITEIQLSHWSQVPGIAGWWNGVLMLLGISILINQWSWVENHRRIHNKWLSKSLFTLISLCLFFTGFFSMEHPAPHNIFAFSYFLGYPLVIFLTAYLNRKNIQWSQWLNMVITCSTMIVIPLILIPMWKGMAPAEIIHSGIVIWWNLWILKETGAK
jgi:hypothetical protein